MQMSDLLALSADAPQTSIVITEADLARPGPTIVHVNEPFLTMAGRAREACLGATPRMLQGPETSRLATMKIGRALRHAEPVSECLINYRPDGSTYVCAVEIHPVFSSAGALQYFVAFEREVVRRRGRPRNGFAGRFAPIDPEALLPSELGFRAAA
jgi:PAS domain S-box-containing protein